MSSISTDVVFQLFLLGASTALALMNFPGLSIQFTCERSIPLSNQKRIAKYTPTLGHRYSSD